MNKLKKKNGFTLVELLAVIVILAVVMLIGGTVVLPMMQKAQKSTLGEEGISMMDAAEKVFTTEVMKQGGKAYKITDSVCYSLKYLCSSGAFDKGCEDKNDNYTGSVLVVPKNDGKYELTFWVSNGTYVFNAANKDTYGDLENASILYSGGVASEDCGNTIPTGVTSEAKAATKAIYSSMPSTKNIYIYTETVTGTISSDDAPDQITTPANIVNKYNRSNPSSPDPTPHPDPYPSQNPDGENPRPTPEDPTPEPPAPKPYPGQTR